MWSWGKIWRKMHEEGEVNYLTLLSQILINSENKEMDLL